MNGTVFRERLGSRTRTLTSLAGSESWKADHDAAMFAYDVQDFLDECLDHQQFLRGMWEGSLHRAVGGAIAELEPHGKFLLEVIDQALIAYGQCHTFAAKAQALGHTLDGERNFERGRIEVAKIRQRILKRWPLWDSGEMGRAMEDAREGRATSLADLIDELRDRCAAHDA